MATDRPRFALYALFFTSGALGLVYEVLWMRRFTVLFGATTLATTATVCAFFLGTAAGSAILGRRAGTWTRPLRAFGLLEIGVGLSALLVAPVLRCYAMFYSRFYPALSPYPSAFAAVKFLLAVVALGLPTFFMGGTLPALGQAVDPSGRRLGLSMGGLYAVNVLGAAAGALGVPFVLLPSVGASAATLVAVTGSVVVGLTAIAFGSRASAAEVEAPALRQEKHERRGGPSPATLLALSAWSGAATLGLEVLWTRLFSLVHENSVYAFAVVVSVFLVGLAAGAALARLALRRHAPARLLATSWSTAAVLVLVSPRLFYVLTNGFEYLPTGSWPLSLARLVDIATIVIAPACVALGMALPLLMELAQDGATAGSRLGRLIAANTLGAIIGPLLVTFVLSPALGLWATLRIVAALTLVAADRAHPRGGLRRWLPLAAAAVALVLARPTDLPPTRIRQAQGERLVSVREDSYGTTAVLDDAHDRWITVNNSYVLGGAAAAGEERWQGHLPLLLHPHARRVAFLGLGTGITASAARLHPVETIVALELVPSVIDAARTDFSDANLRVLEDPRLTVVADDGRNYLAAAPSAFDVVVGDLLVPWRPAEAALYTREHFLSVRRSLRPGGIFCQWLPLYQLTEEQLSTITRTFATVFPQTTVWRGNFLPHEPTLGLIGHWDGAPLDVDAIDVRIRALAPRLDADSPFLKDPAGFWLFLVGPLAPSGDGPLNTDDRPWVELLSARHDAPLSGDPMLSMLRPAADARPEGTPLVSLSPAELGWRRTGAELARASLVPGGAGERGVLTILRTLPIELQRALGADAASSHP